MKQEDKDLLLKDLCARLPYGVKMNHIADNEHSPKILVGVTKDMITLEGFGGYECVDVEDYKPYLFPLSSMTKEQKEELENLGWHFDNFEIHNVNECLGTYKEYVAHLDCFVLIDWLNKNHFDYKGLVEKGLAINATSLNIY